MKLAVFDLDGTLTHTNTVDDECFVVEDYRDHARCLQYLNEAEIP